MLHDFTQKMQFSKSKQEHISQPSSQNRQCSVATLLNAVFKKQTRTHLSTILPKQTMQCCHIVETATAGIIDIYIYGQHSVFFTN